MNAATTELKKGSRLLGGARRGCITLWEKQPFGIGLSYVVSRRDESDLSRSSRHFVPESRCSIPTLRPTGSFSTDLSCIGGASTDTLKSIRQCGLSGWQLTTARRFNSASAASTLCTLTFTATLACYTAKHLIQRRFPFDSAVTVPASPNVQQFEVRMGVPELADSNADLLGHAGSSRALSETMAPQIDTPLGESVF